MIKAAKPDLVFMQTFWTKERSSKEILKILIPGALVFHTVAYLVKDMQIPPLGSPGLELVVMLPVGLLYLLFTFGSIGVALDWIVSIAMKRLKLITQREAKFVRQTNPRIALLLMAIVALGLHQLFAHYGLALADPAFPMAITLAIALAYFTYIALLFGIVLMTLLFVLAPILIVFGILDPKILPELDMHEIGKYRS